MMRTLQVLKQMITPVDKTKFDLDQTGTITNEEIQKVRSMMEAETLMQRAVTQKRMAWVALLSMIVFSAALMLPIIPDARVEVLSDLVGLFFIAQAGVVGAYMGVTAWLSRR